MSWQAPDDHTVEISVVGSGYGESVIAHLGWGDWLIVDSCAPSRGDRRSYALEYLAELGVGAKQVRWLLASHWHDDHVRGFADAVSKCQTATIYASEALKSEEFFALALSADDIPGALTAGAVEMRDTVEVMRNTGRKLQQAKHDQRLFADDRDGLEREIWSLSPSNTATLLSKQAFVRERETITDGRRVLAPEQNEASVALHIRIGEITILLGGDLQWHAQTDRGWQAILASPGRPRQPASLYKVAHHGAPNADNDSIWTELLEPDPVAALAPYGSGRTPRPSDQDVTRLRGRTSRVYLAGPTRTRRPSDNSTVAKMRRRATRNAVVSERALGHVIARCHVNGGTWQIDLRGSALQL